MGQALRTINRQSSDLLEIAETVSSLKLQQRRRRRPRSRPLGQLVMLTQRIGKSANEFLTMEGVSPEAVFLLGKDLNSFNEIAQGLLDGSPELRLPRHARPADPRAPDRAAQAVRGDPHRRPAPILGNLQGLVSAREAQAAIIADSEPLRKGLEDAAGASCRRETGLGAPTLVLLVAVAVLAIAGGFGFLRLYVQRAGASAPRWRRAAAPGSRAPGAGSQARQRRQPGRHSCA